MSYLRTFALSLAASFALVWLWVVTTPLAFMEPEFASWQAKRVMLDRCDIGQVVILGDSRPAADILPAGLPFPTTNLAVGGGEAIEAYAALKRVLRCPSPPRLVILSLDPGHFTAPDLFWARSVRYGFLSPRDIAGLRAAATRLHDPAIYRQGLPAGMPAFVRDFLYRIHFPPLYFASLAHGGLFLRWFGNQQRLSQALAARGHYYFGTSPGSDIVAEEGHMRRFRPLPVLNFYFNRLLARLDAAGIQTLFIAMPVNQPTWSHMRPGVRAAFTAYLNGFARRYRRFHVVTALPPDWPNRLFGDEFCHLNPTGAQRYTAALARRLRATAPAMWRNARNPPDTRHATATPPRTRERMALSDHAGDWHPARDVASSSP